MVYSYDNWVQLPTKQLYDTHIMNMSIAAAKDMYDKGQQAIKDFYTTYGDFVTPIEADQEWYNQNVTGAVRNAINNIYARGGDPLRNAADRAEMLKAIYNVPVGEAAKRRSSAKIAEQYVKNRGILDAAGKYNPQLEAYLGRDLSKWDTGQNGIWQFSSPTENKTMDDIIEPIIKNLEYSYDEDRTKQANDGNDYYTVTEDRIRSTIDDAMPDLMQNRTIGGYYYNQALQQTGDPELAKRLYTQWLVDRGRDHLKEKFVPNEYKKMDREFQYKKQLENMRYMHDLNVAAAKANSSKSGSSGSGSGTSSEKESLSDAQYQLMRGTAHIIANTSFGRAAGITNYSDFDPDRFDILLTGAQKEIANQYYTKDISGGGDATVQKVGETPSFVWDDSKGRFVHNNNTGINLGNYSVSSTSFLPALNRKQRANLHDANLRFIDAMSIDYTPAKFAKWLNRPTASNDSNMSSISNDDDAINRMYSLDEVSLSSSGVDRPSEDLKWAKNNTDASRKILEKNKGDLYIKGVGKAFPHVKNDGSVHMYQIVNVYSSKGTASKQSFNQMEKVGKMAFDMGITTYDNPNHGIGGNMSTNLYFDENKDADVRWSGDQSVLHWEHVGSPQIDATIAYPQLPSTTVTPQLPLYSWGQQ